MLGASDLLIMELKNHSYWKNVGLIKKRTSLIKLYLAKQYSKFIPNSKVIAVSGQLGKTTTAVCLQAVLDQKFKTLTSPFTNSATTSLQKLLSFASTLLKSRPGDQKIIVEIGVDEMTGPDNYFELVKPNIIVITEMSSIKDKYGALNEEHFNEYVKLLDPLSNQDLAILNWEDNLARRLGEKTNANVIYFGFDSKNSHVWAGKMKITDFHTVFELNYGVERVEVRSKLLGFHQIYSMLAAASVGLNFGLSLINIKKGLESISPLPNRMQLMPGYNNALILNDTYNGVPLAVEEALDVLNQLPARRRIVVLGEMSSEGDNSEALHRELARRLYKDKVDLVLLGTGDARFVGEELISLGFIQERMLTNLQNPQIVSNLLKILAKGDLVLVKGAPSLRLDEVVKKITRDK